eukprot:1359075-Rhodomonas_salina.3
MGWTVSLSGAGVSAIIGALGNAVLSKVLKKILREERPDGAPLNPETKDPGMPSSHAMSLFFLSGYLCAVPPPAPSSSSSSSLSPPPHPPLSRLRLLSQPPLRLPLTRCFLFSTRTQPHESSHVNLLAGQAAITWSGFPPLGIAASCAGLLGFASYAARWRVTA